jgi:hypothetical protein
MSDDNEGLMTMMSQQEEEQSRSRNFAYLSCQYTCVPLPHVLDAWRQKIGKLAAEVNLLR